MSTRIGVDIGGTFTDLVIYNDATGTITVDKVPTTPSAPEIGCIQAVEQGGKEVTDDSEYFLHGTTVGLNALLERRGAVVGLLCTEGFRDSLEIRRGSRPEDYDIFWTPPPPLVPRFLRRPVKERINAQGEIMQVLDPQTIQDAVAVFHENGVTSVAICFMNAYANPAHEIEAEKLLRASGFSGDISMSHRISREYRDYERTSTTVVDAFVRTRMSNYLDRVTSGIKDQGFRGHFLITRSGGGSMSFDEAKDRAFETIMSGPVAGAEGAAELTARLGLGDLVTADVGGTSFDTALIVNGRPKLLYQGEVADMPIQAPWVDVRSIGAGGGSIAFTDKGGLLHVGPRSAGAEPGPACYGRGGTEPTVTDAVFYLGMLGDGKLASNMELSREKAEAALKPLAESLNYSVQDTAIGIIRIACANMANAIREITIEQGIDPRDLKLLSFGGAGPMLATQIARELGIRDVIIPPYAGNFSAWGLLGSDLIRSAARTQLFTMTAEDMQRLRDLVDGMFDDLATRGDDPDFAAQAIRELGIGMRFTGQEHSLTIPILIENGRYVLEMKAMETAFREAYEQNFGITLDNSVEVIAVRTALRKPLPRTMQKPESVPASAAGQRIRHKLYSFARQTGLDAPTIHRATLQPNERHRGPAVIYEDTTTTYVDTDFDYGTDENGCLTLHRMES